MKRTMRASSKCPSKDHDPRAVLHPAHWGEQMPHGRTALTAVLMRIPNLQDCEGFSEPKEKSHVSTFPVVLTLPSHSRAQVCFLTMGPDIPAKAPAGNGWTFTLHHARRFNKGRLPRCKQDVGKPGGVTQWPWGGAGPPSHTRLQEVRGGNDVQPQSQRGLCREARLAGAVTCGRGTQQRLAALLRGAARAASPPRGSPPAPSSLSGAPHGLNTEARKQGKIFVCMCMCACEFFSSFFLFLPIFAL